MILFGKQVKANGPPGFAIWFQSGNLHSKIRVQWLRRNRKQDFIKNTKFLLPSFLVYLYPWLFMIPIDLLLNFYARCFIIAPSSFPPFNIATNIQSDMSWGSTSRRRLISSLEFLTLCQYCHKFSLVNND